MIFYIDMGIFFNNFLFGFYIVNKDGELIFIDYNYNINKLLNDMKIIIVFIERKYFIWILMCVYWFLFIGDLLVGVYRDVIKYIDIGKVI